MAAVPMEHLVAAVRALDPGSRALLDLSLRRGVGDVEIARVLRTHPAEVALRRARVLDRLGGTVGVNGSGDLLETALSALPADVWISVSTTVEQPPPPPPTLRPVQAPEAQREAEPGREPAPPPPPPPPRAAAPSPTPPRPPYEPAPWAWAPPPPEPERGISGRAVAIGGVAVAVVGAAVGVLVGRRLLGR